MALLRRGGVEVLRGKGEYVMRIRSREVREVTAERIVGKKRSEGGGRAGRVVLVDAMLDPSGIPENGR